MFFGKVAYQSIVNQSIRSNIKKKKIDVTLLSLLTLLVLLFSSLQNGSASWADEADSSRGRGEASRDFAKVSFLRWPQFIWPVTWGKWWGNGTTVKMNGIVNESFHISSSAFKNAESWDRSIALLTFGICLQWVACWKILSLISLFFFHSCMSWIMTQRGRSFWTTSLPSCRKEVWQFSFPQLLFTHTEHHFTLDLVHFFF